MLLHNLKFQKYLILQEKLQGLKKNIEPYANVVNQVVEDNGIEVKLTDVIIDKDELIFSTIVNTNKAVDGCSLDYDIFINGKKLKKLWWKWFQWSD